MIRLETAPERIIPEHATPWDRRIHMARYDFAKTFVGGKTVLDCACGVGYGTRILATAGARRVIGVDISLSALEFGQVTYAAPNLLLCVQNAECLGVAPAFDIVVSFETLEHLRNPQILLETMARSLVPGGLLIISVPNKAALDIFGDASADQRFSPFHEHEYDFAEFRALLASHFNALEFYFQPCPDRRLARARGFARAVRKTGLIHLKHWLPFWCVSWMRREREKIGALENENISADYFKPKLLDIEHIPADAFVLIAVCRQPYAQSFDYHYQS